MAETLREAAGPDPLILTVPGLGGSGADHWQTLWEQDATQGHGDCRRVELGMWNRPHRNTWVNQLNLAIRGADRPVVLAAHSLGCLAVAWWAQLERPAQGYPVIGALLVAPPEVDYFPLDHRLTSFAPTPTAVLPFPSILVASHNDPYISLRTARRLAKTWGSRFADAGQVGHINAESRLGDWPFGQFLLRQLLSGRAAPGQAEGEDLAQDAPDRLESGSGQSEQWPSGKAAGVAGEASRFAHVREASPVNVLSAVPLSLPAGRGPGGPQDGLAGNRAGGRYAASIAIE